MSEESQKEARKQHYQKNKTQYAERVRKRRIERTKWFVDYKSSDDIFCKECGEQHPATIAFHHRDPDEKLRKKGIKAISDLVGLAYSEEVILNEIAKCDVLCHNCHSKHHWDDKNRRWKC